VTVADREKPQESCSEWHENGTEMAPAAAQAASS
jgi:hypothetical protein